VERGLFIAASGMLAALIRQDVIANNLANATNPGFRGDKLSQQAFGDMLLTNTETGATIGPLSVGTQVVQITPDLAHGGVRWTQNPLDLAVVGEGWFEVQTAQGIAYTRNGAFTTNAQGEIVTAQGDQVLGVDGKPIVASGPGPVAIDRQGRVSVGTTAVGQIALVALNADSVKHLGTNYYTGTVDPAAKLGSIAQGALETSNVNTVSEMVNLIENMRNFEADQKVVRALDDTIDKAVNQVGRV
jgi:flagellar basal-body rod protein FlgF